MTKRNFFKRIAAGVAASFAAVAVPAVASGARPTVDDLAGQCHQQMGPILQRRRDGTCEAFTVSERVDALHRVRSFVILK